MAAHEDVDGKWSFGTDDGQKLCLRVVWCEATGIISVACMDLQVCG